MRRLRPFLHAFCTQEGAWSLQFSSRNIIIRERQVILPTRFDINTQLDIKRLCTTRIAFLTNSYIFCSKYPAIHYSYSQLHSQLASYIVPQELPPLQLETSLLCFYFYPLCYAAVLLKFSYYAQEQELLSDLCFYMQFCMAIHYIKQTIFIQTVLLECINKSTILCSIIR